MIFIFKKGEINMRTEIVSPREEYTPKWPILKTYTFK